MQEPVIIDGSYGEGGGQILRTAVALSATLRKPIEVVNIRAKRDNPGLRPQHFTAIKAVASLCDAAVENLKVGADKIRFQPKEVRAKQLVFDVGTAGSITLLLQALIPVASLGEGVELEVIGGTDVRWSPTLDYMRYVVLPAFGLIGIDCSIHPLRRGYYPKGGGRVKVVVKPSRGFKPITLTSFFEKATSIYSVCSNLPKSVAERQARAAEEHLSAQGIKVEATSIKVEEAISPGTSALVCSVSKDGLFIGGDAIGERGKPAEMVGKEAAENYIKEYKASAPIDVHLGDMLVAPLSLADGESTFKVSRASLHLTTNLYVAKMLTGCEYTIKEEEGGSAIVSIKPKVR